MLRKLLCTTSKYYFFFGYSAISLNTQYSGLLRYRDKATHFEYDLAVLRLVSHLRFSDSISPVCLHFKEGGDKYVLDKQQGYFAGWGITEEQKLADELRRVSMTTLSRESCSQRIEANDVGYSLPQDKFCIINDYKSTACRGDSGGGFVVSNSQYHQGKLIIEYQLLGVISNIPIKAQDCSRDTVVVLTNVQFLETIIKEQQLKDKTVVLA